MRPPIRKPLTTQKEVLRENKYPLDLKVCHVGLDPASHSFGVAVFSTEGKFIDSFTVQIGEGIPTMRLYFIRKKFIEIWEERYGKDCKANHCVIEHLPPSNMAILQNAGGAILSSGKIFADLSNADYILPTQWKFFTRELGCRMEKPKGIEALKSIGWEYPLPSTEDECDAILLYLCSRWRRRQHIWLGENRWLESWFQHKPFVPKKKRVSKK